MHKGSDEPELTRPPAGLRAPGLADRRTRQGAARVQRSWRSGWRQEPRSRRRQADRRGGNPRGLGAHRQRGVGSGPATTRAWTLAPSRTRASTACAGQHLGPAGTRRLRAGKQRSRGRDAHTARRRRRCARRARPQGSGSRPRRDDGAAGNRRHPGGAQDYCRAAQVFADIGSITAWQHDALGMLARYWQAEDRAMQLRRKMRASARRHSETARSDGRGAACAALGGVGCPVAGAAAGGVRDPAGDGADALRRDRAERSATDETAAADDQRRAPCETARANTTDRRSDRW